MTSVMSSFIPFFGHKSCKEKMSKLIQSDIDSSKQIQSLNAQIMVLVNENQQLKATYDYQCFKLEKIITELREKLKSRRSRRHPNRLKDTEPKKQ